MTPQSHFMVLAAVDGSREPALRALLASLNHSSGVVNPKNRIVPFDQFDRLHFARILILDDQTQGDMALVGVGRPNLPVYLAFLADFDGSYDSFVTKLIEQAGPGLRQIFSHCQGFTPGTDLFRWMKDHEQPPATMYVNWLGRTVRQIREEDALRVKLEAYIDREAGSLAGKRPAEVRGQLIQYVKQERDAGQLTLTAPAPTPLSWWLANLIHAAGVPFVLLLLTPFLLLYLPIFIIQLRIREHRDVEIAPRPAGELMERLTDIEDHDVSNQFSVIGSLKPGLFRRVTMTVILWLANYAARHIFNRGHLLRVNTIHFARWVFLDNKQRMFFASNYDGSLDTYMDDFINKVRWGLNLIFSNGLGYPRTNWLIMDGAKAEQKYKYEIRRHELPTEVWYNAHPGLTAADLERNTLIREGVERTFLSEAETREWLKLF